MSFERQGGLRLCKCEHPLAQHGPRPAWFSYAGSSPEAQASPLEHDCYFCECPAYAEGEHQGLFGPETGLKGAEYHASRAARGLPRMHVHGG
jgi:hypothetical protein